MLALLISLLPTIISLVHTTEAINPTPGNGAEKHQTVLDILRVILKEFPALDTRVEPFLALVGPIISVYVMLSNTFGWSPRVAALVQALGPDTQAPAPVEDATITPVS